MPHVVRPRLDLHPGFGEPVGRQVTAFAGAAIESDEGAHHAASVVRTVVHVASAATYRSAISGETTRLRSM